MNNSKAFKNGIKDGIPIALGYFAVSFTLGIIARKAGVNAIQSFIVSATNAASAGQYVAFTLIGSNAAYIEMAIMTLVANARYLLLSCSLSQKLAPDMKFFHRFFLGMYVTDEIFGISINYPGMLNPFYSYGAMAISVPAWSIGTALGVVMGNLLPANIVSALGVGLYGMFIAIIIPPARKNKIISMLIVISMLASYLAGHVAALSAISDGTRTIILTVVISALAAIIFPVREEAANDA